MINQDPIVGVVTDVEPKSRTVTVELADLSGAAIRTIGERWLRGGARVALRPLDTVQAGFSRPSTMFPHDLAAMLEGALFDLAHPLATPGAVDRITTAVKEALAFARARSGP